MKFYNPPASIKLLLQCALVSILVLFLFFIKTQTVLAFIECKTAQEINPSSIRVLQGTYAVKTIDPNKPFTFILDGVSQNVANSGNFFTVKFVSAQGGAQLKETFVVSLFHGTASFTSTLHDLAVGVGDQQFPTGDYNIVVGIQTTDPKTFAQNFSACSPPVGVFTVTGGAPVCLHLRIGDKCDPNGPLPPQCTDSCVADPKTPTYCVDQTVPTSSFCDQTTQVLTLSALKVDLSGYSCKYDLKDCPDPAFSSYCGREVPEKDGIKAVCCSTVNECAKLTQCGQNPDCLLPIPAYDLCKQIADASAKADCECCSGRTSSCHGSMTAPFKSDRNVVVSGLWTAVGCVPTNYQGISQTIIKIGLSIAGGIALLMIIAAAFMLSTSQGEPKQVTEGRELLTSAIVGLLFIIFSITILKFIGVDILHLPGFGS